MNLEDLKVYSLSMDLGEKVWKVVSGWSYFEKDTIGKQVVRSVDSVAANISEGYGRFHYKDAKKFYYYSRGSLYETKTWMTKANSRNLINDKSHKELVDEINVLGRMLNKYIQSIGNNVVREDEVVYGLPNDQSLTPNSESPND